MIQSLDRALSILECLAKQRSLGVSEIAEKFNIDKSTATRVMQTFAAHDIVEKDDYTQKYHMGSGTLQLSYHVLLNNHIVQIARPELLELARLTKEIARLCAISRDHIYILEQVAYGEEKFLRNADIPGTRKPFHCSAIGKVMMAYMPEDELRGLLSRLELRQYTENTICDAGALLDQLREIRAQGYALNRAEYTDRAYCVAVPVFDELGHPSYSIGFSGKTDYSRQPEHFQRILKYMNQSAKLLSQKYLQEIARQRRERVASG